MLKIVSCLILTILTIGFMYVGYKQSKDFFSPVSFYNFFTFLSIVPRLLIMDANVYNGQLADETLIRYTFFTSIGIISINFFFLINEKKLSKTYITNYVNSQIDALKFKEKLCFTQSNIYIFTLFFIGVFSKIYLLITSGGLSFIWANINQRTVLLSGNNYINSLEILMIIASSLMFEKYIVSNRGQYRIIFLLMTFITSLLLLSFGGRSSFVKFFLLLFFVYNYRYKLVRLHDFMKIKHVILYVILILVIVMLPMVRNSDFSSIYLSPVLWISEAWKNIFKVFDAISAVDRDMMTYDLFNERAFWYGEIYLGLFYAAIPRSMYPDKPPVDDGVYLANLIRGFEIEPLTPYNEVILHSSSPFSSFGIMYANFGIIGILLCGFILQRCYFAMYKRMVLNKNIANMLMYGYIMIAFGLSIHSILSFAVPCFLIWLTIATKKVKFVIGKGHK